MKFGKINTKGFLDKKFNEVKSSLSPIVFSQNRYRIGLAKELPSILPKKCANYVVYRTPLWVR